MQKNLQKCQKCGKLGKSRTLCQKAKYVLKKIDKMREWAKIKWNAHIFLEIWKNVQKNSEMHFPSPASRLRTHQLQKTPDHPQPGQPLTVVRSPGSIPMHSGTGGHGGSPYRTGRGLEVQAASLAFGEARRLVTFKIAPKKKKRKQKNMAEEAVLCVGLCSILQKNMYPQFMYSATKFLWPINAHTMQSFSLQFKKWYNTKDIFWVWQNIFPKIRNKHREDSSKRKSVTYSAPKAWRLAFTHSTDENFPQMIFLINKFPSLRWTSSDRITLPGK